MYVYIDLIATISSLQANRHLELIYQTSQVYNQL